MAIKGYIFNLKKYAIHDGPGIRTTVFIQGCPLKCLWCHNPESLELNMTKNDNFEIRNCLKPFYRKIPYRKAWQVTTDEVMNEIKKDVIFYQESGGGVTFSGGEPLIQPLFLEELLHKCKIEGIHTAVDTSGYGKWDIFENINNDVDLFLFDLKLIDDKQHFKYTGVSNKEVLKNLSKLTEMDKEIIIRIPLIPKITDTQNNLQEIAKYLSAMQKIHQIDLLPYNPMGEEKYKKLDKVRKLSNLKHQSDVELETLKSIFTPYGFDINVGG